MKSPKNARDLKRLGLIDYDLRRKLSTGQLSRISRLSNQYKEVFRKPQDFTVRTVSKKKARALHDSGLPTWKNKNSGAQKVIVPKNSADRVTIRGDKIIRQYPDGYKTTAIITKSGDIISTIERLAEKYKNDKGRFFTVQIGENGPFRNIRSAGDLLAYLQGWTPKDETDPKRARELRKSLMGQMMIVDMGHVKPKFDARNAPKEKKWQKKKGLR